MQPDESMNEQITITTSLKFTSLNAYIYKSRKLRTIQYNP